MTSESERDTMHIIETVGAFRQAAIEGVSTVVKATIGDNSERGGDTILEDSMMSDVLLRPFITFHLIFCQLHKSSSVNIFSHLLMMRNFYIQGLVNSTNRVFKFTMLL